jgi:hypothetical protein
LNNDKDNENDDGNDHDDDDEGIRKEEWEEQMSAG